MYYEGVRKADITVYRPSEFNWYILRSASNTAGLMKLGQPGQPVVANYVTQL